MSGAESLPFRPVEPCTCLCVAFEEPHSGECASEPSVRLVVYSAHLSGLHQLYVCWPCAVAWCTEKGSRVVDMLVNLEPLLTPTGRRA